MRILHNVDNRWTTRGHCINEILTHTQTACLRGLQRIVDNVDNVFLATKIKDFDIRVNTYKTMHGVERRVRRQFL